MAKYEFWFDVVETNKGHFTASSMEEANALIEKINNLEMNIDDLPGVFVKNKGLEIEGLQITDEFEEEV
jgi:hypothetical protein